MRIWQVMDECIRSGVSTAERTLPGRLKLRRRAPMLYRRLMRGYVRIYCRFSCIHNFLPDCIPALLALQGQLLVRDGSPMPFQGL